MSSTPPDGLQDDSAAPPRQLGPGESNGGDHLPATGDVSASKRESARLERVAISEQWRKEEDDTAALAVDVEHFQRKSWKAALVALATLAIAVLSIDRSRRSIFWVIPAFFIISGTYIVHSKNIGDAYLARVRQAKGEERDARHRRENGRSAILDSETVEWLNAILAKLWPILNTDLLLPALDIVEDAMKDRFPTIIDTVRIDDLDLGVTPFRVLSIKQLDPDQPIAERHELDSDSTRHVNMEIDFEYRAQRHEGSTGVRDWPPMILYMGLEDNVHMLVWISFGLQKLASIEVPAFVELSQASGTVRVRAELISEPPFVQMATISFPQMVDFTIHAKPLKTFDVLRLPFLSSYVHKAVADVVTQFIAPNAFSMDISRIILGQDADLDTTSQGLAVVVIHSASGLSDTDAGSKSDPFVILEWSKLGKAIYTSRVIRNELNPCWEEAVFVPIPPDALREGENLCLHVWDSDRITADDSLGQATISINELYSKAGHMHTMEMPLERALRRSNNRGSIKFSAGYFKKVDITEGSPKAPAGTTVKMTVAEKGAPVRADPPRDTERRGKYASNVKQMMDARSSPSPAQLSGVLAIQIHQLADLDITRRNRAVGVSDQANETNTPSTYVQIYINDELSFTTRLKRLSSSPYINARTEAFCRDWTRTRIDVAILDYRTRENDAVLGIVSLRCADLFSDTSQMTMWRPILGGIGTGRCRISVLFKPIHIYLPKALRGWNIGTLLVHSMEATGVGEDFQGFVVAKIAGGKYQVRSKVAGSEFGTRNGDAVSWTCTPPLRIPVLRRYQRAIRFKVKRQRSGIAADQSVGEAVLWLCNIPDEEEITLYLPLVPQSEAKLLWLNNTSGISDGVSADAPVESDDGSSDVESNREREEKPDGPCIKVKLLFSRGLSSLHAHLVGDVVDPSLHGSLRMRDYTIEAGERKVGSARFHHRDRQQRAHRKQRLSQAQEAALPSHATLSSDDSSETRGEDAGGKDGKVQHLGHPGQEATGGLGEDTGTLPSLEDKEGEASRIDDHQSDGSQEGWWEDDAAEAAEMAASRNRRFEGRRQDLKDDRLNERGAYQAKITRTFKWLKDGSKRRTARMGRKMRHADPLPTAPETEGISHLG